MKHLKYFVDCLSWLFEDLICLFKSNIIFVCGYFKRTRNGYIHNNWGDDINIFFLQSITDLRVHVLTNSHLYKFLIPTNYSCIGSVIGYFTNKKTIIWGSGLVSSDMPVTYVPKKICSVRGYLTRKVLLERGINCPPIYGDPALLISLFYKPNVEKKYKLGIIPHVVDSNNEYLKAFVEKHQDVLIISMSNYSDWHEIPDSICSCEKIISSSLHGLIVSDSYNVPNLWVKFSDQIVGGSFKYLDYFSSVGRNETDPICIDSLECFDNLYLQGQFTTAKHIDYKSILESCPFKNHIYNYEKYAKNISNSTGL